jgi:hypothetical protein
MVFPLSIMYAFDCSRALGIALATCKADAKASKRAKWKGLFR